MIKKSPTFNPEVTIPLLVPEPDAPCVNSDFLKMNQLVLLSQEQDL